MMESAERTIEVDAPVADTYAVVRDVSLYPRFLHGITAARRTGGDDLEFAAGARTWAAHITEDSPEVCVSWTSHGEVHHSGVITLEALASDRTLVALRIDHDGAAGPGDPTADLDALAGLVRARPGGEPPRRLLSLAAVIGASVTDRYGEPVGVVQDAHLDLDAHMVTSIVAGDGGRHGGRLVALPPLPPDEAARGVVLPYPREMVAEAPLAEPGVEPGAEALRASEEHFAGSEAWERDRDALRARQSAPAPTPELRAMAGEDGPRGTPAPTTRIAEVELERRHEHDRTPPEETS